MTFEVTEGIIYIGADDPDLDLFEGQYNIPHGVSYNSYVCMDDKIAVFDTVDDRKTQEWLANLKTVLKGAQPDYLIISHVEPDHSASIPAFLREYPSVTVVGNEKTFTLIQRFYGESSFNKLTVKDGDELNLGKHSLRFTFAPMVHWPEVMMTYEKTHGILFSADAFGKFGTLSHNGEWLNEARRYYINIVGKYGVSVQNVLKKAAALDIKIICPLHGPVLKDDINYYVDKYSVWSSYTPEEDGVFIAYASIYGNTAKAAKELENKLRERNVNTVTADLTRCDLSEAVANAFKYSKLVIATVTYDGSVMPCAETFINRLKAKNYCNRKIGLIENGSWAPASAKLVKSMLENCKGVSFCANVITVNSATDKSTESKIDALADELSK